MIYTLVIWTVVGFAGTNHATYERYDWRPVGEFYAESARLEHKTRALELCEEAARRMEVKKYLCLKSK